MFSEDLFQSGRVLRTDAPIREMAVFLHENPLLGVGEFVQIVWRKRLNGGVGERTVVLRTRKIVNNKMFRRLKLNRPLLRPDRLDEKVRVGARCFQGGGER